MKDLDRELFRISIVYNYLSGVLPRTLDLRVEITDCTIRLPSEPDGGFNGSPKADPLLTRDYPFVLGLGREAFLRRGLLPKSQLV